MFWPFDKKAKKRKLREQKPRWNITRDCLDMILEGAKSTHPNEFAGMLRIEKGTHKITEILLLPGTIQGEEHAIFRLSMLPADFTVVGTVHSHPSDCFEPSDADLGFFGHFGRIHIIVAEPYDDESWMAYDHNGEIIDLQIVDF